MEDTLSSFQDWFAGYCDGEWEHGDGIAISTLDNPGWSVEIGLRPPVPPFKAIKVQRGNGDWFHCKVENNDFIGYGGPMNLGEILQQFLAWAATW